jgi:hypothetical protein
MGRGLRGRGGDTSRIIPHMLAPFSSMGPTMSHRIPGRFAGESPAPSRQRLDLLQ